jgi:hypothetical protein
VDGIASVFSLLLGYSRVPYAAAIDGNYFQAFARVHPQHRPVSLLALAVAAFFCFFSLADVIAALVVIRITLQFLVQAMALSCCASAGRICRDLFACGCIPAGFTGSSDSSCAGVTHQLAEAGALRAGHPYYRHCHLPGAGMAKSGVAVRAPVRPTGRDLTMTEAIKTAPEPSPADDFVPGEPLFRSLWIAAVISYTGPGCRTWARAG